MAGGMLHDCGAYMILSSTEKLVIVINCRTGYCAYETMNTQSERVHDIGTFFFDELDIITEPVQNCKIVFSASIIPEQARSVWNSSREII